MPLQNERGDVILVFSGEEFPEPGTAQRLKERGHELDGAGPSYLVHLYEEDPSFPAGLNGRFHGLLSGPEPRDCGTFQRSLWDAPDLLPRVKGRVLFRCGSQSDSCRVS